MTKAIILGTNAYPPLLMYWYHLFKNIWYEEVDHVYIAISEPVHKSIFEDMANYLNKDPKVDVIMTGQIWPESISMVARMIKEDLILIPHDDMFIFKPDILQKGFNIAKEGKAATPLHNHYHPPYLIDELMQAKWPNQLPLRDPHNNNVGYSFFCNLFFISRDNLLKTSLNLKDWRVEVGEYCEILDFMPKTAPMWSDVQFYFGLELLRAGVYFETLKKNELPDIFSLIDPVTELNRQINDNSDYYSDGYLHFQSIGFCWSNLFYDMGEIEALEKQRGGEVLPRYTNFNKTNGNMVAYWSYTFRTALFLEMINIPVPEKIKQYYNYMNKQIPGLIKYFDLDPKIINEVKNILHKMFLQKLYVKRPDA